MTGCQRAQIYVRRGGSTGGGRTAFFEKRHVLGRRLSLLRPTQRCAQDGRCIDGTVKPLTCRVRPAPSVSVFLQQRAERAEALRRVILNWVLWASVGLVNKVLSIIGHGGLWSTGPTDAG